MRLISKDTPTPRLLSTVVPEFRQKAAERVSMRSRLKRVSLFTGNGRAIFLGMIAGAILICTVGLVYSRHQAARRHAEEERRLRAVSTQAISTPVPVVVRISADLIHISAISLGQPRLAIINGRQRCEGEQITIRPPDTSVALALRVVRISDGRVELSDGAQTITARLEVSPPPRPKS